MQELQNVRSGIYWAGGGAWCFGICERTYSLGIDGYLSALDLIQLGTAALMTVSWFALRPVTLTIIKPTETDTD